MNTAPTANKDPVSDMSHEFWKHPIPTTGEKFPSTRKYNII